MPFIEAIYRYPVKSIAGSLLDFAVVSQEGLSGDRQFMLVNKDKRMITGRELPATVLVSVAENDQHSLTLTAEGEEDLILPAPTEWQVDDVTVWGDACKGADMGDEVAYWLSEVFGQDLRLIYIQNRQAGLAATPQSFVDAAPLLGISTASVDDLNKRLDNPVTPLQFRPNIVFGGVDEAYGEDTWATIKVGDVVMDVLWGCSRCIFTTVDPETGEKHPAKEPFTTLASYRKWDDKKVYLGQNIMPREMGTIAVGDTVEILEARDSLVTEGEYKNASD